MRHQAQLLINDADTAGKRLADAFVFALFSIKGNGALIGRINTGNNFDNGAFPGAVFADQAVNLAVINGQIHMIQRFDARE